MTLVFYVSGHGLGHASRQIELIDTLSALATDLRVVVRTSAHRWIFERLGAGVEVRPLEADSGVAQVDSVTIDEDETARRAARFYGEFDGRVQSEARYLREGGADLVVGDIAPLAFAAAERAGVTAIAVANFTWDWIYSYYPQFERLAPGVVDTISRAYAKATRALRLPMHGGFSSLVDVTVDVPFIARKSKRDPADTRRALGLDRSRRLVLCSFSGHGMELPYDRIAAAGLSLLAPERHPPAGLKYEDLVAAADVVVSKTGYGIVSECVANGTALLYTPRGRFAEHDVMVSELPRMLRCREIEPHRFRAGEWTEAIDALLAQPEPPDRPAIDGASVAARAILELAGAGRPS